MEFDTAISTCFRKFARFRGRARRSEYWIFNIFGLFCFFVAYIVDLMMGTTLTDEDVKTRIKIGVPVTVHYSTVDKDRVIERVEIDD